MFPARASSSAMLKEAGSDPGVFGGGKGGCGKAEGGGKQQVEGLFLQQYVLGR